MDGRDLHFMHRRCRHRCLVPDPARADVRAHVCSHVFAHGGAHGCAHSGTHNGAHVRAHGGAVPSTDAGASRCTGSAARGRAFAGANRCADISADLAAHAASLLRAVARANAGALLGACAGPGAFVRGRVAEVWWAGLDWPRLLHGRLDLHLRERVGLEVPEGRSRRAVLGDLGAVRRGGLERAHLLRAWAPVRLDQRSLLAVPPGGHCGTSADPGPP
mmetsp:Transcript_10620/g.28112  ORF Transcript_10620/g.28112 Transcript_10620/m.28112 type:complete len:218 (+) Transcript_10620:647-1300(+)